jgi:N-acetylmuramoyl-L-alanine amidase
MFTPGKRDRLVCWLPQERRANLGNASRRVNGFSSAAGIFLERIECARQICGLMKAFLRLLVVCLALVVPATESSAQSPLTQLRRVCFLDRDYLRLADWAGANGFELLWVKKGKTVRLAGHSHTLVFTGDSCEVEIDGIKVWLSFPATVRGGRAYVTLLDMQTAIMPVLFPEKDAGKIKLIALDPGHGGKDKGFCEGPQQEKKLTLLLAKEVRDQFGRMGGKAILTRTSDKYVGLPARADLAQRRGADLFVSLHFNSAGHGGEEARGVEVYCLTPAGAHSTSGRGAEGESRPVAGNRHNDKSVLLAYHLQRALVKDLGMEDRGVRRARFEVLRNAAMPAALIEGGFLSDPVEGRKILDPAYRRQMARAITGGLLAYKRQVEQVADGVEPLNR